MLHVSQPVKYKVTFHMRETKLECFSTMPRQRYDTNFKHNINYRVVLKSATTVTAHITKCFDRSV